MSKINEIDGLRTDLYSLRTDLSWIRRKLEGKQEAETLLWVKIRAAGFGAAVIALIALFLILKA